VEQGTEANRSLVFTVTLTSLWAGSMIVSINAILLGGHMYTYLTVGERSSLKFALLAGHFSRVFACWGIV